MVKLFGQKVKKPNVAGRWRVHPWRRAEGSPSKRCHGEGTKAVVAKLGGHVRLHGIIVGQSSPKISRVSIMPRAAILAAGLHLLDPFRNLEWQTRWQPDRPFSDAPSDPVCGWSKPEMPVDAWLPEHERQAFHPQTWLGIMGVKWWNTGGMGHVEMAAMPCLPFRASVIFGWPHLR